jgi:hypothetical protein
MWGSCDILPDSFPFFLLILTCFLHVFKEEDPGKTYLILREKLIRVDDA